MFFTNISNLLERISAWLLFVIGLMLGYEVTARYLFISPTIWAEELSRLALVWAVFLGASTLIHNNQHIRVTVAVDLMGPTARRMARVLILLFMIGFAGFISWNSLPTVLDSYVRSRSTGSMMDIPSWWMQAAIPVGFALITLQALLQVFMDLTGQTGDADTVAGDGGELL